MAVRPAFPPPPARPGLPRPLALPASPNLLAPPAPPNPSALPVLSRPPALPVLARPPAPPVLSRPPAPPVLSRPPALPVLSRPPALRTLTQAIVNAGDPLISRVVAMVDAIIRRGSADPFIMPIRQQLVMFRPPPRLRFVRLMFHPLDPLIVPGPRWQPGQQTIPRSALSPMAKHVRRSMGPAAAAIEAEIAGRTTADTELITRLGRSFWPEAARVLADTANPPTQDVPNRAAPTRAAATRHAPSSGTPSWGAPSWGAPSWGSSAQRPLAAIVAALLAEAPALDTLCAESASGLLPATAETVAALLDRVARMNLAALPMMMTLLLDRLPEAAGLLTQARDGPPAAAIQLALNQAADLLLGQLDQSTGGTEARIAQGTLVEAATAAGRIATLLVHLESPNATPKRRDRLRAVRRRLNAGCKARFEAAVRDELLAPLRHGGAPLTPANITALEAAARGLRILEAGARVAGGGSTYDLLLAKAVEAIKGNAMRRRLAPMDQVRLVEILSGSDAALAMLDHLS